MIHDDITQGCVIMMLWCVHAVHVDRAVRGNCII